MMFVSLVYVVLIFKFSPFANGLLNAVEKAAAFSIFLMYFTAVMFVCEVDGKPVLDKTQKSFVGICLCIVCLASSLFCLVSSLYEYYYLLLFHGDVFVSNWARALEAPIGDSLNGGIFLYFYAFYNPVSRKSLVAKKRELNESVANLLSFKHSEVWKKSSTWVRSKQYCVLIWQLLRFLFKKRNIAECQPMLVREALDHPEARLFQRLSVILHQHKNSTSQAKRNHGSGGASFNKIVLFCKQFVGWKKIPNLTKHANATSPALLTELQPPPDFMKRFSEKFAFISEALPNDSMCILLAILIFDQEDDMGDSRAAKAYLQLMRREFEPM
jgi:hypothetical protein